MDSKEVVKKADIIILAVKPNIYDIVMESIKEHITRKKDNCNYSSWKDYRKHRNYFREKY